VTPPLAEVYGDPAHRSACWLPDDIESREAVRAEHGYGKERVS
jgi:hypothetical protein